MKIVNVLDVFGKGGGKSGRCMKLVMDLDRMGYEQMVIVINKTDIETHPDIYKANHVDLQIIEKNNIGLRKSIKKIFNLLNEYHPDVVMVWGKTVSSSLIGLYSLFHHDFKYIGAYIADTQCGELNAFGKAVHAYSKCRCDAFVSNSIAGLDNYGIPQAKRNVIYNGFVHRDVPERNKEEILDELGLNVKYLITMAAVMRKEKDFNTFIDCAEQICKERDDIAFLCIGHGPQLEYYQDKVRAISQDRIRVLGFRYDIENYFKASYLSVLCSASEGLSNSILESMAMGTPVLASQLGGTPEIIDDGINGLLLNPKDVKQLKQYIEDLLADPARRNAMSEACLKTVATKFGIRRMTEEFIALFNK